MERAVNCFRCSCLVWLALCFSPAVAAAQEPQAATDAGRPWIVVGASSTTLLGDCPECGDAENYRHSPGVLANIGVSLNRRADVGAEVLWVPSTAASGEHVRTTFVMAAVQVRPWVSRGFFLKAGSGMAFVRNWVVDLSGGGDPSPPFTSKAFALGLGAGWEWHIDRRVGLQIYGTQHVAALGDLQTTTTRYENVVGNFWSVGAAIVIR